MAAETERANDAVTGVVEFDGGVEVAGGMYAEEEGAGGKRHGLSPLGHTKLHRRDVCEDSWPGFEMSEENCGAPATRRHFCLGRTNTQIAVTVCRRGNHSATRPMNGKANGFYALPEVEVQMQHGSPSSNPLLWPSPSLSAGQRVTCGAG
jgi:hypothetical protein